MDHLAHNLATLPLAFAALLPVINPVGTALIILGMVGEAPAPVFKRLALRVTIMMMIFIVVTEVLGQAILRFFGISLPVVQVGGGLTLAAMGWKMLSSGGKEAAPTPGASDEEAVLERAFYPYTFPLTVGPGTIVVVLTLSAQATRPGWQATLLAHAGILLAAALLAALVYVCYRYAPKLGRMLPRSAFNGVQQLISFILLCIGAQIAWGGVSALLASLPAHP
ncbi:MAG: MarC family protein [Metallibacterium scheffleri]|jgi:multiple antibiotic resistance protein|uniref:MarC family protein n=1 Tax=Metallibacterium scheffleri TaxID=993689 RepID=UPI0026EE1E14|nr:MarC family protein [Metallibacterium scheffleri]MCK9367019.1 MarC family protein [Metallibacterium scheffleri]